jgi:hypothetical protein
MNNSFGGNTIPKIDILNEAAENSNEKHYQLSLPVPLRRALNNYPFLLPFPALDLIPYRNGTDIIFAIQYFSE